VLAFDHRAQLEAIATSTARRARIRDSRPVAEGAVRGARTRRAPG
jgi:myo-inositol catabolism protein IolC